MAAVQVISADDALEEFRSTRALGRRWRRWAAIRCRTCCTCARAADASAAADLDALKHYLSAWPEVDLVQVDSEWVLRFNAILELLRRVLGIAALLLGAGVLRGGRQHHPP